MARLFAKLHKLVDGFPATRDANLSPDSRLFFLAADRLMGNGCAPFKDKGLELDTLLGVSKGSTNKAIGKLKAAGVLMPESSRECLVINPEYVTFDLDSDKRECPKHGKGTADDAAFFHPHHVGAEWARKFRERVAVHQDDEGKAVSALRAMYGPRWWESIGEPSQALPDVPAASPEFVADGHQVLKVQNEWMRRQRRLSLDAAV